MSKKVKTAAELRAEADKMLKQAEAIEAARAERIGRYVMKLEAQNWADVTIESFREGVAKC